MAKHPVPKKKVASSKSAHRYAAFVAKKYRKLRPFTDVRPCPSCGTLTLLSLACPMCGKYHGREAVSKQKKVEKVLKVKA